MKKLFTSLIAVLFCLAIAVAPASADMVYGKVTQGDGAGVIVYGHQYDFTPVWNSTVQKYEDKGGPFAAGSGSNSSVAMYEGHKNCGCLYGGALTIGDTRIGAYVNKKGTYSTVNGKTWNTSLADHNGYHYSGEAHVRGNGELTTGTFAGKVNRTMAYTYTNGTFNYKATGNNFALGVVKSSGTSYVNNTCGNKSASAHSRSVSATDSSAR
jgi:hypothetical protein